MVKQNGPILLLAGTAGCLDAFGFLGLGRIFTANMTGNTVLLGLAIAQGDSQAMLRSLVTILGVLGGTLITEHNYEQPKGSWAPQVAFALVIEGCLLLVFALTWLLTQGIAPRGNLAVGILITLSALAMGLQSATVLSLGIPGVSTTYITGTITTLMANIGRWLSVRGRERSAIAIAVEAQMDQQKSARMAAVWLTYILAAIIGGAGALHFSALTAFLPLLVIGAVIVYALIRRGAQA